MNLKTRKLLQWTLDRAEDCATLLCWPQAVFTVLSLKRRIGLRYWRKGL